MEIGISVLIKTLNEFRRWMDTAAISPANKRSFWERLFGATPQKKSFNRADAKKISEELGQMVQELNTVLFSADEAKIKAIAKEEEGTELQTVS